MASFFHSLIKIMPGTTPEGYKVIYCDLNDRDPKNYSLTDQMRVFDMAYLLWLNQNEKLAEGFVFVANVINMNLAFFAKMNLSVIRKFAVYLQVYSNLVILTVFLIVCHRKRCPLD